MTIRKGVEMLITVNEASERPIYAQIADGVRAEVIAGHLHAGDTLPPARSLAIGLGINVHTVLRAYQLLRDEGLIDLRRRRGAVVTGAAAAITELKDDVAALVARAARAGVSTDTLAALISRTEVPLVTAEPQDFTVGEDAA